MFEGGATAAGTARYASRFRDRDWQGFFRPAQGLTVASIGIGSYLGAPDDAMDAGYRAAMSAAVAEGINFFDTSLNYRHQRSERSLGAALKPRLTADAAEREELVVCTKAGYLVPGAEPELAPGDIIGGMHSMASDFLRDQLDRSRENLGLKTVDVFYLHNPEVQLRALGREEFYRRIKRTFETMERLVVEGKTQYYGVATWDGLRRRNPEEGLSLSRMVEIAHGLAGDGHHLRFVQLPLNLSMVEAHAEKPEVLDGERVSVIEAAQETGVSVVASATLLQARLARDLPDAFRQYIPGLATDAQRAIQFTRSTPGLSVALVGMARAEHVRENMEIAWRAPLSPDDYQRLFQPAP